MVAKQSATNDVWSQKSLTIFAMAIKHSDTVVSPVAINHQQ